MFLQVGFDAAEFVEKLVVLQDLKILHMEVSFGVSLEALVGLPRINAFQDTNGMQRGKVGTEYFSEYKTAKGQSWGRMLLCI